MFSDDTVHRLTRAATLVNTASGARGGRTLPERLDGDEGLAGFLDEHTDHDSGPPTGATRRAVRKLRSAVAGIWQDADAQDTAAAVEGINLLLASTGPVRLHLPGEPDAGRPGSAPASPDAEAGPASESTVRTPAVLSGSTARIPAVLQAGRDEDPAERRLATAIALALADVALAGELTRLRICAGVGCENAFVDLTRNRSKQFCDEANCANRAHVRAYRARRAAEEDAEAGTGAGAGDGAAAGAETVAPDQRSSTVEDAQASRDTDDAKAGKGKKDKKKSKGKKKQHKKSEK